MLQRIQLKAMAGIFLAALNCVTSKDSAIKIGFEYYTESAFEGKTKDILLDVFGIQIDAATRQELAAFISRYADDIGIFDSNDLKHELLSHAELGDDEAANIDELLKELKGRYPQFRDSTMKDIAFMILNQDAPCDRVSLTELLIEFKSIRDIIQYSYIERFSMLLAELQEF